VIDDTEHGSGNTRDSAYERKNENRGVHESEIRRPHEG
jgi:hypothetical protein